MQHVAGSAGLSTGMQTAAARPCSAVRRSSSMSAPGLASRAPATTGRAAYAPWTCTRRPARHTDFYQRMLPVLASSHSNGASSGAVQATLPSPLPNIAPEPADPAALHPGHHSNGSNGSSNGSKSSKEALTQKLEALAGKYEQVDDRLDSLERTLVEVMKEIKHRRGRSAAKQQEQQQKQQEQEGEEAHAEQQADSKPVSSGNTAADGQGGGRPATARALKRQGLGSSSDDGEETDTLSETDEDDDGGGLNLSKIQSNITETVNGGYLESMRNLRQTLMASEWDMQAKHWARRRGVSNFELHCATNGIDVDYEAMSKLYENPERLDVLPDIKQRLLARAMILQAVDDRHKEVYKECTELAKELASQGLKDLLPETPAGLTDLIKSFLPSLPFLKK